MRTNTFPGSSGKYALSFILGFYLVIFPVLGTTTIFCFLVALAFRLNLLILQAMNLIFFPLQLWMIYPFMFVRRLAFFSEKELLPDLKTIQSYNFRYFDTFAYIAQTLLGRVTTWAIFSISTGYFLYRLILKSNFKSITEFIKKGYILEKNYNYESKKFSVPTNGDNPGKNPV